MYLSDEEEIMLSGEEGETVSLSMEVLTKIGAVYGAERMVHVRSAHTGCAYSQFNAAVEMMEKFADLGGKFRTFTTVNPTLLPDNCNCWDEIQEPDELKQATVRQINAINKMGVIPNWSCTPYFQGNLPRLGEPVSWVESSAVIFANSVLGARTNRTTMGVDIASAITGRVPEFGLLLKENRAGNVLVALEFQPSSLFDYNTIGFIIGKLFAGMIPVIEGLPPKVTANELKVMGAAAAIRGGIALYHAVGVTPEARTREEALQGKKPLMELTIREEDVKVAQEEMCTIKGGKIDAVLVGCPHPSVEEIKDLAGLLIGKTIRKDIKFCLFASLDVIEWSRQMGYIETIESSGVKIFVGGCIIFHPTGIWGWKNIATNSAKLACSLPSYPNNLDVLYVDTKQCVDMATI
ncbi:aconitase X [Chloroflexota bacterium]